MNRIDRETVKCNRMPFKASRMNRIARSNEQSAFSHIFFSETHPVTKVISCRENLGLNFGYRIKAKFRTKVSLNRLIKFFFYNKGNKRRRPNPRFYKKSDNCIM